MKKYLPWIFLAVWVVIFALFLEFKLRTAAMLWPIILIGFIGYLLWVTITMWPKSENKEQEQKQQTEENQ